MRNPAGIYQIRDTVTGKVYVGSAVSLRRRWYEHSAKIAAANVGLGLGSKKTPETLAKMRLAAAARVRVWKTAIVVFATAGFWSTAGGNA